MLVHILCLTSAFVSQLNMIPGNHFGSTTKSTSFNVWQLPLEVFYLSTSQSVVREILN